MSRAGLSLSIICVGGLLWIPVPAQQPNTASATLLVNFTNHAPGGTGPVAVSATQGGALVITMQGTPLRSLLLVTGAVVQPGTSIPPFGILDVAFPFLPVFNGFSPTTPFDLFAFTSAAGTFELAAAVSSTTTLPGFGLQGAVADPASAGGAVITAAANVTITPFTSATTTINEASLGDDVTVTYFHQALAFPFYGATYGRTHIDTNGYLSFGAPFASEWMTSTPSLLGGGPRIAPFWSDLHMSSTVQSAFGYVSVAPASLVITETAMGAGMVNLQIDWQRATEAVVPPGTGGGLPGNQYDFRATLDSAGLITFLYGSFLGPGNSIPAVGNTVSICGISPGGNLSTATTSRDLVVGGTVAPFTGVNPNDAIFERFDPSMGAFSIDLIGPGTAGVSFQPLALMPPGNLLYSLF